MTCNPITHHSHNLWNVEGHENERGEDKEKKAKVNFDRLKLQTADCCI